MRDINSFRLTRFFGYFLAFAALTSPISAKPWKGAEVISKQTFLYGAFEARIQAAKGGGVITPFFLWKDGSEVAGAQWQEQDFEIFGRDGMFQTQVMTPGEPRTEHIQMHYPATPAYERYNTYRMEWTPDSVCFYFNGFLIRKETDKAEFSKLLDPARAEPMQLRVSNWAGDGLWSGRFDSTALPADVYVNWIQAYAYTPGTGPGGSNFTSLWRDEFDTWNAGRWWTANWTFEYAVNDYVPGNAQVIDGALNLALTHWSKEGTFRPVPPDDGLTPPLRPGPVDPPEDPVYDTVPVVVPARLAAVDYARAFETVPGNQSDPVCTSRNPNVDLEISPDSVGGVCYVSSTQPSEWLEYDIEVEADSRFVIGLNMASERQSQQVVVLLDGVVLDTLAVPSEGWQAFRTVALPAVALSVGPHILRVVFRTGEANLHYIDVLPTAARTQTIAFEPPTSPTYGTEFVVLSASSTSGLPVRFASANPAAVRVSRDTAYLLAADTATLSASQPGDSSFLAAAAVSRIVTVAKKPLTIAGAKASNKVYDGTVATTISDAVLAGVVGADAVSLVVGDASFANKDAGTAKLVTVTNSKLSGAQAGNYSLVEVSGLTADITPKPITVTAAAQSKVYGSLDPALTYTATALSGGDVFTGGLARVAGDSVGSYAIGRGTLAAGGNYALTYNGDSLSITRKALTITGAKASDKVYDGTVATTISDAVLAGVVGTDAVSLVLGAASFANKDTGTAKVVTVTNSKLSGAQAGNYSLVEVSGLTADITPKPITVTAAAKSKVYGSLDPALTYTATALSGGDVFTGGLARVAGDSVGKYAIGRGTLAAGGNYALTYNGDSLSITKKSLTITGAKAANKVYDGTTAATISDAVLAGLVGADAVSLILGDASFANKDTGTAKAVTLTGSKLSGAKSGNYSLGEATGLTANITPKPITVTAAAKSKVYGSLDPALTYTATALAIGDVFTGGLARVAGDSVGRYAIGRGTLAAGGNYALTYNGDSLSITKKSLTITGAKAANKVYDGTTAATISDATLAGVVGTDAVSLVLGNATFADKDAGTAKVVTVTGSKLSGAKAGNYSLTESAGLVAKITPKPITVTAAPKSKIVGSVDPVLTYMATVLSGTDAWSGALMREAGESAGTYPIRLGTLAAGGNYAITFAGADFTITQSTAIAARPVRSILSQQLEARAPRVFASPSTRSGAARMESFVCEVDDISCLSVDVLLPGASRVSVAIFDNLGVPVISFERDLSKLEFNRLAAFGDGRRVLPVAWNLRARNGAAVEPGVFLWWIVVDAADGQKLETVKKLGVKRR